MNTTLKSNALNYYLCRLQRETKLVAKFLQGNIFLKCMLLLNYMSDYCYKVKAVAQRYTEYERKINVLFFFLQNEY